MTKSLEDRILRLVLLGPPGGGKGTQAKMIFACYHIPHISTGDMFRVEILRRTKTGKHSKPYIEEGGLVPDDITNGLVTERVCRKDCLDGYILDGYPRTVSQAQHLESKDDGITAAICLEVETEGCVRRLLARGRKDDRPEVIEHRFDIYRCEVGPIAEFYQEAGKLLTIDGNGEVEDVARRIWAQIDRLLED